MGEHENREGGDSRVPDGTRTLGERTDFRYLLHGFGIRHEKCLGIHALMVGEQLDGLRRAGENRDLWEKVLAELNRTEKVLKTYVHVKGHQDNLDNEIVFGNNVADYLASYKNQNGYELDIPLKEEKKLKLYYFYDMDNDEVYADWVKRETHHVSVGECKKDSVDEVCELWQKGERYLDFGHTFHYIGTRPSTKTCVIIFTDPRRLISWMRGERISVTIIPVFTCRGLC